MLGDLTGFGSGNVKSVESQQSIDPALLKQLSEVEKKSTGSSSGSSSGGAINEKRSGFKALEYLKDLDNWKALMTGGDAILFSYELPLLGLGFGAEVPLARIPLGPVMVKVDGLIDFQAVADLAFGYDTFGIRKAIDSGNPIDALDGFFVHDWTLPTFSNGKIVKGTGGEEKDEFYINASVGLQLSAALGPISGGGLAEINFYAGLDLQDIATSELTKDEDGYVTDVDWISDGRIRGSEIATMYDYEGGGFKNLFNIKMGADFVASVFVKLDLFVTEITLFKAELFRINLFNLELNAPRVQPYLAEKQGDTLYLNVGSRAELRKYFNTTDGGENVVLSGSGGTVTVSYTHLTLPTNREV